MVFLASCWLAFLFLNRISLCSPGWPQVALKFTAIILLQPPECWGYKCESPHLACKFLKFCKSKILHHSPPPIFSFQLLSFPFPLPLQFMASFSILIVGTLVYKYDLLSRLVLLVCDFRAEQLDNQLGPSSWGIVRLPFLSEGNRLFLFIYIGMLTIAEVVQVLFFQPCC